jgi:hypothetical protein
MVSEYPPGNIPRRPARQVEGEIGVLRHHFHCARSAPRFNNLDQTCRPDCVGTSGGLRKRIGLSRRPSGDARGFAGTLCCRRLVAASGRGSEIACTIGAGRGLAAVASRRPRYPLRFRGM